VRATYHLCASRPRPIARPRFRASPTLLARRARTRHVTRPDLSCISAEQWPVIEKKQRPVRNRRDRASHSGSFPPMRESIRSGALRRRKGNARPTLRDDVRIRGPRRLGLKRAPKARCSRRRHTRKTAGLVSAAGRVDYSLIYLCNNIGCFFSVFSCECFFRGCFGWLRESSE